MNDSTPPHETPLTPGTIYEFGPFRFDTGQRILARSDTVLKLKPKALEVLECLLQHRNKVVEKEQIMQQVWPDSFVEDANLTVHISALRKFFVPGTKVEIETFPKKGYRFSADVREVRDSALDEQRVLDEPSTDRPGARVWMALGAIVAALSLFGVWYFSGARSNTYTQAPIAIGVLPFEVSSEIESERVLGGGLSDNLARQLSEVPGLRVINPDPSFLAQHAGKDPADIARELGVRLLMSGKIETKYGEIIIAVRYFDEDRKPTLWDKSFLRRTDDLQQVEWDMASEITAAIDPAGLPETDSKQWKMITNDQEAYRNFLIGRGLRLKMGNENLLASLEYYRNALSADPDFALAYASVAEAYYLLANNGGTDPSVALPLARAALNKALALDENLNEAILASADLNMLEWKWDEAEADFLKAIELAPYSVKAHRRFARFLGLRGSHDRALDHMRSAESLEPMSLYLKNQRGVILLYSRRYQEALKVFREHNKLQYVGLHHFEIGWASALLGDFTSAVTEFEAVLKETDKDLNIYCYYGYALAKSGDHAAAKRVLTTIESRDWKASPAVVAFVHIGLGDKATALDLLEQAYRERDIQLIYLNSQGMYDSLRSEPRFIELCRKVGLPVSVPPVQ